MKLKKIISLILIVTFSIKTDFLLSQEGSTRSSFLNKFVKSAREDFFSTPSQYYTFRGYWGDKIKNAGRTIYNYFRNHPEEGIKPDPKLLALSNDSSWRGFYYTAAALATLAGLYAAKKIHNLIKVNNILDGKTTTDEADALATFPQQTSKSLGPRYLRTWHLADILYENNKDLFDRLLTESNLKLFNEDDIEEAAKIFIAATDKDKIEKLQTDITDQIKKYRAKHYEFPEGYSLPEKTEIDFLLLGNYLWDYLWEGNYALFRYFANLTNILFYIVPTPGPKGFYAGRTFRYELINKVQRYRLLLAVLRKIII